MSYFLLKDAYFFWKRVKVRGVHRSHFEASNVYWLKKVMDLHIIEGTIMSTCLSEFNPIFSQLIALKFIIDDEFKATFLLCTLAESLDIFRAAMSNSNEILLFADVERSISRTHPEALQCFAYITKRSQQKGKSDNELKVVTHYTNIGTLHMLYSQTGMVTCKLGFWIQVLFTSFLIIISASLTTRGRHGETLLLLALCSCSFRMVLSSHVSMYGMYLSSSRA